MSKWLAEFELEDGDIMPEHMDLEYKGARIDFHCRPLEQESTNKNDLEIVIDAMEYRTNALIENIKSEIMNFANAHCSGDDINIYDVFKVIDDCCEAENLTTKNDLGVSSELEKNSKKLEKDFGESDCVPRIAVIDYLCKHCPDDGECFKDCDEIKHLRQIPSVTPIRPKGHWIETAEEYYKAINEKGGGVNENTDYFVDDIACSECLAKFSVIDNEAERFDFCPCCGSDNR